MVMGESVANGRCCLARPSCLLLAGASGLVFTASGGGGGIFSVVGGGI